MTTNKPRHIEPLARDSLPAAAWSADVPVRFRHCDAAGIVFTPRFFDMLHEGVERFFLEALGINYYAVIGERRLGLGYGHASCEFLKPCRMGDTLEVVVLVEAIGTASYTFCLPVFVRSAEALRGRFVTVTTSLADMKPRSIPDDIREALAAYRDRCGPMPQMG